MDSYCVIHFKNKPEKGKILTFLAIETEAEYHVTTDLKGFVAKQFGVTILENNKEIPNVVDPRNNTLPTEQQYPSAPIVVSSPIDFTVSDQQVPKVNKMRRYIETITTKDEVEDGVENVVTTTNNTLPTEQLHQSAPIVLPTPMDINVVDQQVPVVPVIESTTIKNEIDDTVEDVVSLIRNNNEFHNFSFLPPSDVTEEPQNLTSMVEPKQEIVDDEVGFVVNQPSEGNVPKTGRNVTEETTDTNEDVPSTSEGNRKRPYYSAYNYIDNETAVKKRKDDDQAMVSGNGNKADKCQKCERFNPHYQSKDEHAMDHAKIKKYICLVDGCRYKNSYKPHIVSHMKKEHSTQLKCFKEVELTYEQQQKMEEVRKTCFPEMKDGMAIFNAVSVEKYQCKVCKFLIYDKHPIRFHSRKRTHAIHHLGIELYKCTEDGCCYKAVTRNELNSHKREVHGGGGRKLFEVVELTDEQESQVEEMLVKCFPN